MYLEVTYYFDVWGNAKDGYEVNNQTRVGYLKTVGPRASAWPSKLQIVRALKRLGQLKPTVRVNSIEWDDVYMDALGLNEKDGRPVYFLSTIDEKYLDRRLPVVRVVPKGGIA